MLSKKIRFIRAPYPKKYTAIMPDGSRSSFGDRRYEQYKDSVPKSQGGGLYAYLNHKDKDRRKAYRKRHSSILTGTKRAIDVKYSPAWFSYYYLW